ncbi:MAG: Rossmann-like and DUF2520 domain-containing protein [Bacteroidales bacterium]|nr:Rossmann-like and DUF2520 domain-containing protein [Bacteroidales bacterium]
MKHLNHFKRGVVIIGAGNVATHIALALKKGGYFIRAVYSKTQASAQTLAEKIETAFTTSLKHLPGDADLYIISVKDSVIEEVAQQLILTDGVVVHTSGSTPMSIFSPYFKHFGVFYPLQTFTKSRILDFSSIPLCIEANNHSSRNKLISLASSLSNQWCEINSEKRKILHLAAVFTCNFTNHMYAVGYELLQKNQMDFNLLHPLINETAKKANEMTPLDAQTGPARRNDKKTLEMHLEMLKDNPDFEKIYRFVSESIYSLTK